MDAPKVSANGEIAETQTGQHWVPLSVLHGQRRQRALIKKLHGFRIDIASVSCVSDKNDCLGGRILGGADYWIDPERERWRGAWRVIRPRVECSAGWKSAIPDRQKLSNDAKVLKSVGHLFMRIFMCCLHKSHDASSGFQACAS